MSVQLRYNVDDLIAGDGTRPARVPRPGTAQLAALPAKAEPRQVPQPA